MGYPLNSAEDVQAVMAMLSAMGIGCTWSGLCVWIDKDARITATARATLEDMGARRAKKRGQWFFRACDGLPRQITDAA